MNKPLSDRMHLDNKKIDNAYTFNVTSKLNAYDTFCLICAEFNIKVRDVVDSEFESCSMIFEDYCKSVSNTDSTVVSVWFE